MPGERGADFSWLGPALAVVIRCCVVESGFSGGTGPDCGVEAGCSFFVGGCETATHVGAGVEIPLEIRDGNGWEPRFSGVGGPNELHITGVAGSEQDADGSIAEGGEGVPAAFACFWYGGPIHCPGHPEVIGGCVSESAIAGSGVEPGEVESAEGICVQPKEAVAVFESIVGRVWAGLPGFAGVV